MSEDRDYPLTPVERVYRRRRIWRWTIVLLVVIAAIWYFVFESEYVVAHESGLDHFYYGSIGSEAANGLPVKVFKALPVIYRDRLGPEGWGRFGFLFEPGRDLPIGTSTRHSMGFEFVWLNCSVCHVGTVSTNGERRLLPGAPSNNLKLYDFITFLLDVGRDPGFNADTLVEAIDSLPGEDLNPFSRLVYRLIVFPRVQQALLDLNDTLAFVGRQHDWGPGRVDTFNPYKAIQFNFPMGPDTISDAALNGSSDFPSIWQQRPREGMFLHWDGNNPSVDERNLSAALGAGVTPRTVDVAAIKRVKDWMWTLDPPAYPGPIDHALAARGEPLYAEYCAGCHGARPLGKPGERLPYDYDTAEYRGLGRVVPLDEIGTDRGRWASYTDNFAAAQNMLYAGTPYRFNQFRKTSGYANHPLDGIWARSPYLHNGSVPTLAALLEPADARPERWYRGSDTLDLDGVGYASTLDKAPEDEAALFLYDTTVSGNGNDGHDGPAYGTDLPAADKRALVEYMKTL